MSDLRRETVRLAMGLTIMRALKYPFDYLLYPLVLLTLGNLTGGFLMIVLSLINWP